MRMMLLRSPELNQTPPVLPTEFTAAEEEFIKALLENTNKLKYIRTSSLFYQWDLAPVV